MTPQPPRALSDADLDAIVEKTNQRLTGFKGWTYRDVMRAAIDAERRLTAEQSPSEAWVQELLRINEQKKTAEQGGADDGRQQSLWVHDLGGPTETIHDKREAFGKNDEWTEFRRAALTTQPQAEPSAHLSCGHPASLMLASAETGEPLYCELCDDKSGRRDAERREAELSAELAEANETIRQLNRALGEEINGATFMGEPAPPAQPQADPADTVSREDFFKLSEDLTRAKRLIVRLWEKHPDARAQIEGSTGTWFIWGQDRALVTAPTEPT